MAIYKCKMCNGELNVSEGITVVDCDYCGTKQTVPTVKEETLQGLFNRANVLRVKNEFDKAEQIYERIIQEDNTQAEAYWGLILCKFGIEYVEDPATFKRVPTCHRTSLDSIIADEDYKSAILYADSVQRGIYEAEAKEIDRLQKEIIALSQKEEPYDVFICYKETDDTGSRTQDSVIANDIYYQLTQEGFKVFYAAITLEDKLGSAYEPCIFAALNSAKVMLAVGTKPEYFNAVWVKNEWGRFLKIMKKDRSKVLIPCYKGMDAYELPEEFAHLQAQDMSKIGFISDLVRGMKKVLISTESAQQSPESTTVRDEVQVAPGVESLLERAFMLLEDGKWEGADAYCEKVLDIDPKNGRAYLGKLMAELSIHKQEYLHRFTSSLEKSENYKKVLRFADPEISKLLESAVEQYNLSKKAEFEKRSEKRQSRVYDHAVKCLRQGDNRRARNLLRRISGYLDADSLLEELEKDIVISLAKLEKNDLWGYINEAGEWVIKPQFDDACEFAENGLALVRKGGILDGKWGYINEAGEWVIEPQFDNADSFEENGLAAVRKGGKWGYINEAGEWVIEQQVDYEYSFAANGLAAVEKGGKWGYINEAGEWVIEPKFDKAKSFEANGLAAVKKDGKWGYINETGEWVIEPKFDDTDSFEENGLAAVEKDGKWGYINEAGEWVFEPQFDYADSFEENGLAGVEKDGKWVYINEAGEWAFELQFDSVDYFGENGLAAVEKDGKWGYINETGEWVIELQFDDACSFAANGLAAVEKGGKWGYINEAEEWVIELQFDDAYSFAANGLAAVEKGGKWGYINEAGEWVIKLQFDDAESFEESGLAAVEKDGKRGCINEAGIWVIPSQFEESYPVPDFVTILQTKVNRAKQVREKAVEERRIAEEKAAEERRIAEEKAAEEKVKQQASWRTAGVCQHCGGQLKGMLSKKCVNCGRKKDY